MMVLHSLGVSFGSHLSRSPTAPLLKEAGDRERSPARGRNEDEEALGKILAILRQSFNTLNAKAVPE
jgi:hypothetical protein